MQHPSFNVKIIGGKLVKVPDFNYIKEHQLLAKPYTVTPQRPSRSQATESIDVKNLNIAQSYNATVSYPKGYVSSRNYHRNESMDGKPRVSTMRRDQDSVYNQLFEDRLAAERNRLKALEQTYQSVLASQPMQEANQRADIEDERDDIEDERDNNALSKQVADCLKSTNKQKIAYALRAMRRLDMSESGYITTRQFRDVLLMYQIFIIGGTLEKLIEKYKSNGGKINYAKLWSFVTDSYGGHSSNSFSSSGDGKDASLQHGIKRAEKHLKAYAQRYHEIFDFTDLTNSIKKCDRGRSGVIGENELRILCRHYLPIDDASLQLILQHCSKDNTSWIIYSNFLRILSDAQPIYLPPINNNSNNNNKNNNSRRNTYLLKDEDLRKLRHTVENNEHQKDNADNNGNDFLNNYRKYENNSDLLPGSQSIVNPNKGTEQSNNGYKSKEGNEIRENGGLERNDTVLLSARRKWYESEDAWRKRKRKMRTRRKPPRRRWENSAPVRKLRNSADNEDQTTDDVDDWQEISEFSGEEKVHAEKFQK